MATTTETTIPSWSAALLGLVVTIGGAIAAYVVLGAPPLASTEPKDIVAFGSWLIRFGLVLAIVGMAFSIASTFGAAMAKTTKTINGTTTVAAPASTSPLDDLKDLIGATAALVAVPAGVGSFTMLVGAILIVGVVFGT
jgi:hypothetical protein